MQPESLITAKNGVVDDTESIRPARLAEIFYGIRDFRARIHKNLIVIGKLFFNSPSYTIGSKARWFN
jgi:hypothetical protein